MTKRIGVLTAGGDCPGLNAAIRGVGKTAQGTYDMRVLGFRDGFRGLVENRVVDLDRAKLSGILTIGGTILGTSRDKPHKMRVDGRNVDMTDVIVRNYAANHLDALVCLGGGGTQKNALVLQEHGLNVITLPKTIDNDVGLTDVSFGFDTALGIATDAIDRLHSTAHSHHRIIVVEIMGHRSGWLALGAGMAGGADVILLPEIPYDIQAVAKAVTDRVRYGLNFSIVAVAEGAMSMQDAARVQDYQQRIALAQERGDRKARKKAKAELKAFEASGADQHTLRLARQLEALTGLESRPTILGHLQRGGTPSAADRLLATRLGSVCADLIDAGHYGVMVAARGDSAEPVPLEQVAGNKKLVPPDHPWVKSAKNVGICLGVGV
ncbi:6-phosphofructokinase [Acidihalobacter ferrooxydans]|uniref:ATP-dependent 6-phosphofructokinase n=1 Tax=Acidihalobacter ferrooxydans TaxID=1765967 RepID=A0A1P8UGD9_9GAMM|nr:ATP-dependent 6-phosphofructokinase [Acidihalobacter ferrooxydans]APZ42889.1 6-phosphofructokinase [Acidihalobacter ferrooxydans]